MQRAFRKFRKKKSSQSAFNSATVTSRGVLWLTPSDLLNTSESEDQLKQLREFSRSHYEQLPEKKGLKNVSIVFKKKVKKKAAA